MSDFLKKKTSDPKFYGYLLGHKTIRKFIEQISS